MYRAYKFRMYPNDEQKQLINKTFGCSRFVYNYYLEKSQNNNYKGAYSNIRDYTDNLKYKYPFLQEIDSIVIRKSLFNLDDAFKKFYNKDALYPKFKSKYNKNSYNTNAVYRNYKDKTYCNIELNLLTREIKLPKLGNIKVRGYRNIKEINGKIKNATISRDANGKYYVSVLYEVPDVKFKTNPNWVVGIDLGVKEHLTLSDGIVYENNRYIEKYEKRIQRKQRELAKKQKGSKNYYKCKHELAVLYSKLKNARKYKVHEITKEITDNYDIIVCENLNVKSMLEKKKMSKQIADVTLSEVVRVLQYKCQNKGKYFYQVDTYYPSSQICERCDNQDRSYKDLNKRIYECKKCGSSLDRDLNASINIMWEGLKIHYSRKINVISG